MWLRTLVGPRHTFMAARPNTGRKRPSDLNHRHPIRLRTAKAVVLAVAAAMVVLMLPAAAVAKDATVALEISGMT